MPRAASTFALDLPPAGPRLLALWLPGLPLQRLARARETSGDRPVAVVEEGRVRCCDEAARAAGVRAGQTLAEALAACGPLLAVPHAPAADRAALRALAEALLAIAPAVEVSAPDALLLDAARRSKDEQLFRRATDIALQARAGDQALSAAKAWRAPSPACSSRRCWPGCRSPPRA